MKTISPLVPAEEDLPSRIQLDLQSNNNGSPRKSWKVHYLGGGVVRFKVVHSVVEPAFHFTKEIDPLGLSAFRQWIEVNPVRQYVIFHSTGFLLPTRLFENVKLF